MSAKSFLTLGALAVAMAGFAFAKSYDVDLLTGAKAGTVELKPGVYKVKVEGSQALFTDSHGKSVTVPVKVENGDKKFGSTRIESATQNGADTIQAIDLGDSNTRLVVGQ
jgi:predicted RNA binding protein YcfA (HicA-like mRNA interferase family)